LLKAANTKNYEDVKIMVKTLVPAASADDMGVALENILTQAAVVKDNEEKRKSET
jgi:hypothetical protein